LPLAFVQPSLIISDGLPPAHSLAALGRARLFYVPGAGGRRPRTLLTRWSRALNRHR
jgi:hypothetical protein